MVGTSTAFAWGCSALLGIDGDFEEVSPISTPDARTDGLVPVPIEASVDVAEPADRQDFEDSPTTLPEDAPADSRDATRDPSAPPLPLHRYTMNGVGPLVWDSYGGKNGFLNGGAMVPENGQIRFDGVDDYIELPKGIVSSLQSVTVMAWLEWQGDTAHQRIFDFGMSTGGLGTSYLFLATLDSPDKGPHGAISNLGRIGQNEVIGPAGFPTGEMHQATLILNASDRNMHVYLDAAFMGSTSTTFALKDIKDEKAWIGRSQYASDPYLKAILYEFRIYDVALNADAIAWINRAGPDAP